MKSFKKAEKKTAPKTKHAKKLKKSDLKQFKGGRPGTRCCETAVRENKTKY